MSNNIPKLNLPYDGTSSEEESSYDNEENTDMKKQFLSPRKPYIHEQYIEGQETLRKSLRKTTKPKKISKFLSRLGSNTSNTSTNNRCVIDDSPTYFVYKYSSNNKLHMLRNETIKLFHYKLDTMNSRKVDPREINEKFNMFLSNNHIIFFAPFSKLYDLYELLKSLKFCNIYGIDGIHRYVNKDNQILILIQLTDYKKKTSTRREHTRSASLANEFIDNHNTLIKTSNIKGSTYEFTEEELKSKYKEFMKENELEGKSRREIVITFDTENIPIKLLDKNQPCPELDSDDQNKPKIPTLKEKVTDNFWNGMVYVKNKFKRTPIDQIEDDRELETIDDST